MNLGHLDGLLQEAAHNENLGYPVPATARLRFPKRVLMRISRLYLDRQMQVNRSLRLGLQELGVQLTTLTQQFDLVRRQMLGEAQESNVELHSALAAVQQDLQRVQGAMKEVLEEQARREATARRRAAQVDLFLTRVRQSLPEPPPPERLADLPSRWDGLYGSFEEVFRGSFEEVQRRLHPYLADLPRADREHPVLDVGCGRGEWLDLLSQNGIPAYGVDLNEEVVRRARERGFHVLHENGLRHLEALQPGALSAVTGFHVAEHLQPDDLLEFLDLALRALRPGGLLLLETPNPTNLVVGASTFYLDPSHVRPLHPQLLSFLADARGYVDISIRSANDTAMPSLEPLADHPELTPIFELLNQHLGSAPDYALLAHRL